MMEMLTMKTKLIKAALRAGVSPVAVKNSLPEMKIELDSSDIAFIHEYANAGRRA